MVDDRTEQVVEDLLQGTVGQMLCNVQMRGERYVETCVNSTTTKNFPYRFS